MISLQQLRRITQCAYDWRIFSKRFFCAGAKSDTPFTISIKCAISGGSTYGVSERTRTAPVSTYDEQRERGRFERDRERTFRERSFAKRERERERMRAESREERKEGAESVAWDSKPGHKEKEQMHQFGN